MPTAYDLSSNYHTDAKDIVNCTGSFVGPLIQIYGMNVEKFRLPVISEISETLLRWEL